MKISFYMLVMQGLLIGCVNNDNPSSKPIKPSISREIKSLPRVKQEVKTEKPQILNNETRFYTNLSSQFDFRLTVLNNDFNGEPSGSVLKIYHKDGGFIQKFEIANNLMGPLNLKEMTSFQTKVKFKSFGQDNMFGTLIVEDFNFDSLYDIALMNGCAVNGNSRYNYYLQQTDSTFKLDKYLTNKVATYPRKRNSKMKQLKSCSISCNSVVERTIQYNDSLRDWNYIKTVIYE